MNFPFISNSDLRTEVDKHSLPSFVILASNILPPQVTKNFRTIVLLHHPATNQCIEIQVEANKHLIPFYVRKEVNCNLLANSPFLSFFLTPMVMTVSPGGDSADCTWC